MVLFLCLEREDPIAAVAEACACYPTEWLTHSPGNAKILVSRAKRGYYTHYGNRQPSVLCLDSKQNDKAI